MLDLVFHRFGFAMVGFTGLDVVGVGISWLGFPEGGFSWSRRSLVYLSGNGRCWSMRSLIGLLKTGPFSSWGSFEGLSRTGLCWSM